MAKKRNNNGAAANGEAKPSEATAAYFLSLTLCNIRCFGDKAQTLDLSDGNGRPARWTVLLGNNGTGKTTILQALANFEIIQHGAAADTIQRGTRSSLSLKVSRSHARIAKVGVGIATGGALKSFPGQYERSVQSWEIKGNSSTWTPGSLVGLKHLKCYGYGASRRLSLPSLSAGEDDDATASLFDDDAPLRNAEEWLLQLDYSARIPSEVQDQQKRQAKRARELLIEILPEIEDIRFTPPTAERRTPLIEFQTKYGWVPLRQLGHGYRTLIAWIVDFVSRLVDRFPDSPNPLEAPAVVLVDEIDLHMHPIWQRQLMRYLTTCFQNTQFIVTAHSPLIVQAAAEDANIALLRREGDHVVIDNDLGYIRGWSIDQLLTSDLFGLPSSRPPQFDAPIERRKQLLMKSKLTKEEKRQLADLEKVVFSLPGGETAEQAKTSALIHETLELLKKNQPQPQ